VKLPSSLETLTTKQYSLTTTQRLIGIMVIGLIAILIIQYMTTLEVEPTLPINNNQQAATSPSQLVIPRETQVIPVNQVEQTMRDPFARPPEAKEQRNNTDQGLPFIQNNIPSHLPAIVAKKNASDIPPGNLKLTGIVGSADQRLAVIMSANKSRSYSVKEVIGTYTLMSIHNDYVVLTNADGKLVLKLEPSGQKGGTSSEK